MLVACPLPHPGPVYSALDLCKAMLSGKAPGETLMAAGLDRVLRHDAGGGMLEVQAGVTWDAIAPLTGGCIGTGTVGQWVADNRAGPDGRPIVAHVCALTLASADGELRRADRKGAAELFGLAIGGFGVFGPFYSLTLDRPSLAGAGATPQPFVMVETTALEGPGNDHEIGLLLPPAAFEAALSRMRAALDARRARLVRLEARRTQPESDTRLRWAHREFIALRIGFRAAATLGASVGAAQLRSELIDLAIEAGGAFELNALAHATRAQAAACYPMLGEFLAEKRRLDPAERVTTPWYRTARRVWRGERCAVRWRGP